MIPPNRLIIHSPIRIKEKEGERDILNHNAHRHQLSHSFQRPNVKMRTKKTFNCSLAKREREDGREWDGYTDTDTDRDRDR